MKSSIDSTDFLIIIPAFNESENIPLLAEDLSDLIRQSVIINDGSVDDTGERALECGFNVITHPFNMGIGRTVQTGLKYARSMGFKIAIQYDGDYQHRVDQISCILDPVVKQEADLVIGSRWLTSDYPYTLLRRIGGGFFSLLLYLLTLERITDPTSGFRCFGERAIDGFIDVYPEDYPEVESVLFAKKMGLRLQERAVKMRQRTKGRSSITTIKAIYYMIKVSLGLLTGYMRSAKHWRS